MSRIFCCCIDSYYISFFSNLGNIFSRASALSKVLYDYSWLFCFLVDVNNNPKSPGEILNSWSVLFLSKWIAKLGILSSPPKHFNEIQFTDLSIVLSLLTVLLCSSVLIYFMHETLSEAAAFYLWFSVKRSYV